MEMMKYKITIRFCPLASHDCCDDANLFYMVVRDTTVDHLEAPLGCFDCPAGIQEHWPTNHAYRFELRQAGT